MKNKVMLCLIGFVFIFMILGLGSALLCIGSDGYYHDCSDDGSRYRKAPVKTVVQTYNMVIIRGSMRVIRKDIRKVMEVDMMKGMMRGRKRIQERRKVLSGVIIIISLGWFGLM